MKECGNFRELISASLDCELTGEEQTNLNVHLRSCQDCRQRLAILQQVGQLVARAEGDGAVRAVVLPQKRNTPGGHWFSRTRRMRNGLVAGGVTASALLGLLIYSGQTTQPQPTITAADLVQPMDNLFELNRRSTEDQHLMRSMMEYELRAMKLQLKNASSDSAELSQFNKRIDGYLNRLNELR